MKFVLIVVLVAAALIGSLSRADQECPKNYPLRLMVSTSKQVIVVYENGEPTHSYHVSTGSPDRPTKEFHGKFFQVKDGYHDSSLYPDGDYQDPRTGESLGNMPYAMRFDTRAIHGTPLGNYRKMGTQASHGCVRMYSPQAKRVNRLVKKYGQKNTCLDIADYPYDGSYPLPKGPKKQWVDEALSPEVSEFILDGTPGLY